MQPTLEDEAALDPVAAFQPFGVRLLWEQEGQAVSVTCPLALYQDCPRVEVTELSLWPQEQIFGPADRGFRQPFSLFSSWVPQRMALGEHSENAKGGAVTEWWKDVDAH